MKPISKLASVPSIESKVKEYDGLREESKIIKKRTDDLAKEIKEYAENNGVKDDKGSFYCDLGGYLFGKQAKKSVSFKKDEAIEFFKTKKLFDAVKIIETIDEDAVEKYISEGNITFEDLESITETKVTYAIDLKKKEDMPEVEEVTLQMAASSKPKSRFKK